MKMRKLSYFVIASILGLFVITACDDGPEGPELSQSPTPPEITAPSSGESYVLEEANSEEELMTLEWNEANYGFSAPIGYRVEMSAAGTDFGSITHFGTMRGVTEFSPLVGDMNASLISAGAPPGQENDMEIRVRSALTGTDNIYSESIVLTFTPYDADLVVAEIYMPGNYQSASGYGNDWTPEDAPALTSPDDDGVYEGYVYFHENDNMFKITPERNWDADWGVGADPGTLDPDGGDIPVEDAGYYRFVVDIENLEYETTATEWGLIGEAVGGWGDDDDVMMTYDIDEKVWSVTTDLSAGLLKFRANGSWDLNYGDDGADGTLQLDGDDITVPESGNFTVTLDLSSYPYTYSID